jgi:hypothetical protein
MGGEPLEADAHLHAAAVAAVDAQSGRFGDDHQLGADILFLDDVFPAQTVAVLFHDRAGEKDGQTVRHAQPGQDAAGGDHGRRSALLVDAAAAMHETVGDTARKRRFAPVLEIALVDSVDMGVNGQQALAFADSAQDAAQAVQAHVVEPGVVHLFFQLGGHLPFPAGQRFDPDQAREVLGRIVAVAFGQLQYFFGDFIHAHSGGRARALKSPPR